MLAGPGSFSTNKKGGGIREDEKCGGRKRERERAREQQVCRNGLPSCKNSHSVPSAVHQTKLPQAFYIYVSFFLFHVHCFTQLKQEVKRSNFCLVVDCGPQESP